MPYAPNPDTGCWDWTGYCDVEGTPVVRTATSQTTARRWIWQREIGPIEDGLKLVSVCGNVLCVRPSHHDPVDHAEAAYREGQSRLSPRLAAQARALTEAGASYRAVGRVVNASARTIGRITAGEHWTTRKHV